MRNRPLYDVVALLARVGVGIVFLAHGWQKIQVGITATSENFDRMGVPGPTAAAIYATFTELLGGLALIAGLGLPVAGTLLFVDMAGAFAFVHAGAGLFLVDQGRARNGFELVLVLGLVSLVFAAGGGGRISLDHRLFPRRDPNARRSAPVEPPAAEPVTARPAPGPLSTRPPEPEPGTRRPIAPPQAEPQDPATGESPPDGEPAAGPKPKARGKRTAGRLRRKPPPEPPAETAPQPRLASDIIGDVYVAGRRRPEDEPDDF